MASPRSRIKWQEAAPSGRDQPGRSQPQRLRPATPLLDELGRDLTLLAGEGRLDPVFGREKEIRQLLRILMRKKKNNPLISGDPGVGKTALVEGLAQAAARGQVPQELQGLRLVELPVSRLTAGTIYRGSFEARLEQLLREAGSDPELVLFFDEIHTLIRSGAGEGNPLDAANILKPALARGEIRCIGATTPDEFDRFLRSDPAFERRFHPLKLEEPSIEAANEILAAALPTFEAHHRVRIQPEAVRAAVQLSVEHILDRRLPDKAFDLLDDACTLVRLPASRPDASPDGPLVTPEVVAQVLAEKLGLPWRERRLEALENLPRLESTLGERILGQPFAVRRIAQAVQASLSGLASPDRPRHIFAFFGGSGVGKSAAARSLAEALFGTPEALIRLDMSEYKEPYSLSRLFGSPPGYVGYQDEVTFASRLRRQPFAVVLLDEVEKAHPEILDAFLQVFDAGRFTDSRGRTVDARQAFFILTSNLFSVAEIQTEEEYEMHAEAIRQRLPAFFRPEFIDRIDDVILFSALPRQVLAQIAGREIAGLNQRLARYGLEVRPSPQALDWLAGQALAQDGGARAVLRLVARHVTEPVTARILEGEAQAGHVILLSFVGEKMILKVA